MKLAAEKSVLTPAFAEAARSADTRPYLPALSGVLIDAREVLSLTTTDLEVTRTALVDIGLDGDESSTCLAPAAMLAKVVAGMPDGTLTMSVDDDRLIVKGGRSKVAVRLLQLDDFPRMPTVADDPVGAIDGGALGELVAGLELHTKKEPSSPLAGVHVHAEAGRITAEATDSYTMVQRTRAWDGKPFDVLLPVRTAVMLGKLGGEVEVSADERRARFTSPELEILSTLNVAAFPDLSRFVPTAHTLTLETPTAPLLDAIRSVMPVAHLNQDQHAVASVEVQPDGLLITSGEGEKGQGEAWLPAKVDGEPPPVVTLNAAFLMSALKAVAPGRAVVYVQDELKPLTIRPADGMDEQVAVIMPIRV